jgi:hypothetical protein
MTGQADITPRQFGVLIALLSAWLSKAANAASSAT